MLKKMIRSTSPVIRWPNSASAMLVAISLPRSLSGEALSRLTNIHDQIRVLEMAGGEVWRIVLDTWGIGGIGLFAVLVAAFRRGLHQELRIMATLVLGVTTATVYVAPAALPVNQPPVWASGRYPDAMELTFFIVGIAVLLTARSWRLVGYASGAAVLAAGTGAVVANYVGASISTSGFAAFNFAEPAVLAQGWTRLSVAKSTAVAVALLALWVVLALVLDDVRLLLRGQLARASRGEGCRGALAVRQARPGQLGQGAGGLARRGQEPSLRLGGLGRPRRLVTATAPVTETAR
jgi:hypothetical protein